MLGRVPTISFLFTLRQHAADCPSEVPFPTKHACSTVEFPLFGNVRSCYVHHLVELSNVIRSCQAYLPSLSISGSLIMVNVSQYNALLDQHFGALFSNKLDGRLYTHFEVQIKRLSELSRLVSAVPGIQKRFIACSRRHKHNLSFENKALVAFGNIRLLGDCIAVKQISMENFYSRVLDNYPERTEGMLRSLMCEAQSSPYHNWDKLLHVKFSNFSTLGVARWLDNEIINYFIDKWCHAGTTLGLNTFFACKHLFQKVDCLNAKSGTLTLEDQTQVLRWCQTAMRKLHLDPSWDAVFIPIHENASHWYSALIDFSHKRIKIYDSIRDVRVVNCPKPLPLRKNTNLMLVLMWLTEVLGHMRGDPVRLSNNPATDWTFDSHSEVHFQPNAYDCGVHILWHLKHILEFRQIRKWHGPLWDRFSFSDNMVGKCLSRLKLLSALPNPARYPRRLLIALKAASQAKHRRRSRKSKVPNTLAAGFLVESSGYMDVEEGSQFGGDSVEDKLLNEPGSLVEVDEVDEPENKEADDVLFEQILDDILRKVRGAEDDKSGNFVYLPDPGITALKERDGAQPGVYCPMNHSLVEDDIPSICVWNPTAGKVFGYQLDAHERWKKTLSGNGEPFTSHLEWEMARWAVNEKVSQKSFDRLLQIPQLKEKLGLNITVQSVLKKVDEIPDRRGPWSTKQLCFKDRPEEYFIVCHRNPISVIKALWGNPDFVKDLVYKPVKMFQAGAAQLEENRIYNEMWTAGFWNAAQCLIPVGGTVAPVIIASDKTQLTQFSGSKNAYPVYLTIGNIPKALRHRPGSRACTLIAYLFADKLDKVGLTDTTLKLRNYELLHRSMSVVLEPLKAAGDPSGPGIPMVSGDGAVRIVYPLLATYIANYPEQCLVTCTKYGTCPICQCSAQQLDLTKPGLPRTQEWTYRIIKEACEDLRGQGRAIHARAMKSDVAGGDYEPCWMGFPLTDIHRCIAPDVLHQLYQGVFKHLVVWVQTVVGEKDLDQQIRALPLTDGIRHFSKGISGLAQLSGTEHKDIARFLLACLVGKVDNLGITACRALLHFIQLAQYPSHDGATIGYMKKALRPCSGTRFDQTQLLEFGFERISDVLGLWLGLAGALVYKMVSSKANPYHNSGKTSSHHQRLRKTIPALTGIMAAYALLSMSHLTSSPQPVHDSVFTGEMWVKELVEGM
ncbi:hypothetical protein D9757_014291 [Collybiopsis confluens]|uniref:Ubiquitin-like protease family profile domain-containing protein n=1 Tax=Collybiopsis confluens TaxID=2823264 RepID=A0A8H5D2E8_9AGAR|nr:hypothetical protein D9757_014291 [Collybiopsis confluens]